MAIYSGYIDCGNSTANYEFTADEGLDAMGQLLWLIETGTLQIMPDDPEEGE